MKKILLFMLLMSTTGIIAQNINKSMFRSPGNLSEQYQEQQQSDPARVVLRPLNPRINTRFKSTNSVTTIPIGQSGNAWGFSYMRTTYLWAVNDINSISFIHRMDNPPGSGFLAYDLSTDGGMTWSNNNQVYDPTLPEAYNARYPQGVIYNPTGNTNPENAYFSYFAPTLDGSNATSGSNWGGVCLGVKEACRRSKHHSN